MRRFSRAAVAAAILLAAAGAASAKTSAPPPLPDAAGFRYVIGPGDVLDIQVWRHPDFSRKILVRPDGTFSYPFVGEVNALDRTIPEVSALLAEALGRVINGPVVTINVESLQSQKIFVLGEVNLPGVYPFEGRVSAIEAIGKAGGFKPDIAEQKSVMVIRRATGGATGFRLDLHRAIHKADAGQNPYLAPGDIVFVPKTFIANVTTFIQEFFTKTNPVVRYYLDVYDATNPGKLIR